MVKSSIDNTSSVAHVTAFTTPIKYHPPFPSFFRLVTNTAMLASMSNFIPVALIFLLMLLAVARHMKI